MQKILYYNLSLECEGLPPSIPPPVPSRRGASQVGPALAREAAAAAARLADCRDRRLRGDHGIQLSRDPTNFRGLVLGCIEAKFCK